MGIPPPPPPTREVNRIFDTKSAREATYTSQFSLEILIQMENVKKYDKKIKDWRF
jgi:hypothetical protein